MIIEPETNSPYTNLPPSAFWKTGVVGHSPAAIPDIYRKKFSINRNTRVATAGSCFAQHIAKHLKARRFSVIDAEPAPPGLSQEMAAKFGYGLFSARYANIYTARQLRQIVEEAFGTFEPADAVWEKNGRFYDAMRPSVEPRGLSTPEKVREHREFHLRRVQNVVSTAEVFVFTLGLTEAWIHGSSQTSYPTAPGTIAGRYDPSVHVFKNFTFQEIYDDVSAFFRLARDINPQIKFLLTVSPVPLMATASGEHVLSATIYSKSVLRAVAGQLAQEHSDVDYFPSYEIITGALSKGAYFEDNLRSIRAEGVAAAMNTFLAQHDDSEESQETASKPLAAQTEVDESLDDVVCEEMLLEAFSR